MPQWVLSLCAIGLLGFGAWIAQFLWHRRELTRLATRESLEMHELFARYYASLGLSEASIAESWREIATTLKVPPGQLRPDDRFGAAVGTYMLTSDELDTLSELGEKRARQLGINVRLEAIETVDDYVRTFAQRA